MLERILQFILIGLSMGLFPYVLGELLTSKLKWQKKGVCLNYLFGWLIIMFIFQIFTVIITFLGWKYSVLRNILIILYLICFIVSIILYNKELIGKIIEMLKWYKDIKWQKVLMILLILFQVVYVAICMHQDADDAFYVAAAATTLKTNTLYQYSAYTGELMTSFPARYVFAPFPILLAFLSDISFMNATIFAHTVFPVVFIAFAYMVYYIISELLFENESDKNILIIFISMLNIFGNSSVYTMSSFLLLRIWQGKAVLSSILLPAAYAMWVICKSAEKGIFRWICLLLLIVSCCFVSSMGVALAPIVLCALSLVDVINKKEIKQFIYSVICCLPALLIGILYIVMH